MAARRRLHLSPKRLVAIGVGTLVLLGFGTGVVFASTSSSSQYRTAIVARGDVDETLQVDGTIASASRSDLAFPVGGTVASIAVAVGDTVQAGDTLAKLDTTDLQDAVDQAQSAVDQAQQTLDEDLSGQTSTSSGTATSTTSASAPVTSAGLDPAVKAAADAVVAAQGGLLSAITASDAAVAAGQSAAAAAQSSCGAVALPTADDPESDGLDATQTANLQTALAAAQAALATCQSDSAASVSAAGAVATAQSAVDSASASLDTSISALQTAIANAGSAAGGGGTSTGSGADASGGSGGSAGGSGGGSASAADIVADRAAIAAAEADLAIAKSRLASATLTATTDGTVAQITFTEGETVASGDDSAVVSVIGNDGYLIESTVSLTQVKKVSAGQDAAVTLSSSGAEYAGTVTQVGIVNVSETSDPAYAVTVSVDSAGDTLLNGAAATAQIVVGSSTDVLTVPLSALHSDDTGYTVDKLVDGAAVVTSVQVGAIGASSVEITSGLSLGDTVVLADMTSDIPSSGDSSTGLTGLGSSGGSFPQGGFTGGPPAGFTGGQRNG